MNVLAQLEIELVYHNVIVQNISHYIMGTPPGLFNEMK